MSFLLMGMKVSFSVRLSITVVVSFAILVPEYCNGTWLFAHRGCLS